MPPRKYTDDQLTEAADLREIGLSHAAIACRLDMSVGAVSWHCLRLGADSPNTRGKMPVSRGPMVCTRSGYNVRKFTAAEDATILAMDLAGATTATIARALAGPGTRRAGGR
ncbi:hypothetical protein [Paracoccus tegillarcae]|uniref:Helix-turn-helix domain-containing protein n=1 Tax=Paracoccus tegillarcae TaxID=1529068 RepID=A0A2K9EQA7_9RHOB|nr:hypothetical protein [Paracoccus tegillarcae]AUH35667.1 hypothetical protein CUV01_18960 [Paracoccus tegillarcae]